MTQVVTTGWPDRLLTLGDWESLPADELHDVEVLLSPAPLTVRSPDVLVAATAVVSAKPPRFGAADVSLVVEIMSEGSRGADRVTTLSEYADTGIGHYWIIDLDDPVSLVHHRLDAKGAYQHVRTYHGHMEVVFGGATVRVDLDALSSP